MTNKEYIDLHPEKFKDDIDKWLFTEFSIIGGCCSAQGSMEYSVARMVAEKMKQQIVEKACEWLEDNLVQCWIEDFLYVQFKHHEHQEKENVLADFRKAMEE